METAASKTRIDKYLWAIRIFKTRALATQACELEKVAVNGQVVKPSRTVLAGQEISIRFGPFTRMFKVIGLIGNRLPARRVPEFCTEITPPETIELMKAHAIARAAWRKPGLGRPTKKERREMDDFLDMEW